YMELKYVKPKSGMNKNEVNELTKDYIYLCDDVFIDIRHKHNWKCKCGNIIYSRKWVDIKFKQAIKCEECKYNEIEQRYKHEVEKTGEYEYIRSFRQGDMLPNGKVVKGSPCIQVRHLYCGRVYEVKSGQFINVGIRCSKCCQKYENSIAHYIEVDLGSPLEKYWSKYNKINPYHTFKCSKNRIWIKCENSKHSDYETYPYVFTKGHRCKFCSTSKGEERIENYLIKNKINHVPQKEYSGLIGINNGNLSYDFYLSDYNLLIEYQGGQHERYVKGMHSSQEDFKKQQEHDRRKKKYSENNNIKLLEIWYWDFDNIENILEKELNL
ncbi:hypothetical protein, partial [Romboutsia sp.]|uniref:hypothetical protein n=1 Tax=Romboutsia sp. TaxID=1965302 RepID=UPI002BA7599C